MPNTIGKGIVEVGFDQAQASKAAQDAVMPGMKKLADDIAGLAVGKKLFDFGKAGFEELGAAQKVSAQTSVILKNLGETAGVTADDVDDLAASMLKQSGVDDEVAKAAENTLLRLGVTGDAFKEATQDSNDLATAMGTDMTSAAELLGKALAHPEQAAKLLKPAIGGLTDEQKASIAAFQAQGDVAGAQGVIFDAVEAKVKGAAAAYGDTLPGKLAIAKESMTNVKAELVAGMAPALEFTANGVTFLTDEFDKLPESARTVIGTVALVGGGIASVARPVKDAVDLFRLLRPAQIASAAAADIDAASQGADAVATEANAAAHGSLLGKLGTAGVVGVAAAATVGLYAYGRSLNKTTLDTEELNKLTSATPEQLGKVGDELLQLAQHGGAFGGMLDDTIQKLVAMGPAGVGTLQKIRDQLAASGQDTSTFDKALSDARSSQDNLNSSIDEGTDSLHDGTQAQYDYAAAMKAVNDERLSELDGLAGVKAAEIANTEAQINARTKLEELTKAQKDHTLSSDEQQSAVDGAKRSIFDAANAAGDLAVKTATLNGVTDSAPAKQQAMVASLTAVRDTLKPGSPLYNDLQTYINQLLAIPTSISTQVHFSTDGKLISSGGGHSTFAAEGYQGWVKGGSFQQFVTGEKEDEYVSIVPKSQMHSDPINAALASVGDRSGDAFGSVVLQVSFPNYVGDKNDLVAAMTSDDVVRPLAVAIRQHDRDYA